MRYRIDYSLSNGLGKPGLSLFFKGCDKPNKCINCHNPELQNIDKNKIDVEKLKREIIRYIDDSINYSDKYYVSFLGGDPLTKHNREYLLKISKFIKEKYKNIETVVYTWRSLDKINNKHIKYIDYGVLGEFKKELHQKNMLPGSKNQVIYDFNDKEELDHIKLGG